MSTVPVSFLLQRFSDNLLAREMMVAVAESCTGGSIAKVMTDIPGSSRWFERGFVTYSNVAKTEMLGVTTETLMTWGAVSEQAAIEMAEGALAHSHAGISVAVTGIAGPDGGTDQKPVGTVCFAWSHGRMTRSATSLFSGDRESIRAKAVMMAIQGLLDTIESTGS